MSDTKSIERGQWPDFAVTFSNGNRGRLIELVRTGEDLGAEELVRRAPFFGLDRDPLDKGDDIVISVGGDEPEATHRINGPTAIRQQQDDDGVVRAVEIEDGQQVKIIIRFLD